MARSGIFDGTEKWRRLGAAVTTQIAEWSEPQKRRNFIERFAGELSEAGQEIATTLLSNSWRTPEAEIDARIGHLLKSNNLSEFGVDPFGFSPEGARDVIPFLEFLYRVWFRAEVHGLENVPAGRCLLISNHSGQLPFDGAVIAAALLLERNPPRMPRGMVEKFATALPYFGQLCIRCGQITGLPDNCRRLLETEEAVLVFPEGARGINKVFSDRYKMTPFGHGFMRLALQSNAPIVPIACVGGEEQTINLFDFKALAKILGSPSLPITPLMPFIGPLAMLPSPVKYRVYFGKPLHFEGDANDDEAVIAVKVAQVRAAIQELIDTGLQERRGIFI